MKDQIRSVGYLLQRVPIQKERLKVERKGNQLKYSAQRKSLTVAGIDQKKKEKEKRKAKKGEKEKFFI